MSIAKQRSNSSQMILRRGLQMNTDVNVDSPNQSNQQHVNVVVNNNNTAQAMTRDYPILEENVCIPEHEVFQSPLADDNVENVPEKVVRKQMSFKSNVNIDELMELCKSKDNLISALSIIVDIYQHNPLIINRYIIADEKMLTDLLYCLTSADEINISKQNILAGSGCLCKHSECDYASVSKIMIRKDGQSFNFKYSYPNVIQFLDERNISWKFVC